ncbi:DoxX family protein [Litoreibacter roseus]|uniref:DoxX family protein n=1 Tax=Litoreibacter roseus TaxID=2601869 RepID=A0A6N6JDV9_9RHOB|nr:DoxX family protein [Litoreibacter roseus]GFE64521.1 hypothetical protein KIN_15950 [Litoreibacter roseus]
MPLVSGFAPQNAPSQVNLMFQIGRIVLVSLFVLGGVDKLLDPNPALAQMRDVGLPMAEILIWPTIAVELGLGLLVAAGGWLAGGRFVAIAALALIAHTAAVNVLFHDFWTMEGAQARLELSLFFKNVAVAGALAMVAGLYLARRNGA